MASEDVQILNVQQLVPVKQMEIDILRTDT